MTDIDDKIRFVVPIMLDDVSVRLGPWSGYHVLAQHHAALSCSQTLDRMKVLAASVSLQ